MQTEEGVPVSFVCKQRFDTERVKRRGGLHCLMDGLPEKLEHQDIFSRREEQQGPVNSRLSREMSVVVRVNGLYSYGYADWCARDLARPCFCFFTQT